MGRIKKIIGGMVKGPDRIDELADRITGLSKRLDEGGERIIVMESRVNELDVGWYMDKILDDRNLLSQLNRGLSISPTVWGDPARLEIDPTAAVNSCFFNTNSGRIIVGRSTYAGSNVSLLAGTHDTQLTGFLRREAELREGCDIEIGQGVWLASGCTIIGPCRIGDNAVIAAGAVVVPGSEVPANEIWGGVPAKKIGAVEKKRMSPENPAVMRAFERSDGMLFTEGWGERTPDYLSLPGHWMHKQEATLITNRRKWKMGYRKEGSEPCRIHLKGPEGEKDITLTASEGRMDIRMPVKDGEPGEVTLTRESEEKVFMTFKPIEGDMSARQEAEAAAAADTGESRKLDIERIMEEIRADARRREPYKEEVPFDQVSGEERRKCSKLMDQVETLTDDYVIPESYDFPSRNPVKIIYKKAAKKAVRFVSAPMSARITETNLGMKTALEKAVEVIEDQDKQIKALEKRIEELEKRL